MRRWLRRNTKLAPRVALGRARLVLWLLLWMLGLNAVRMPHSAEAFHLVGSADGCELSTTADAMPCDCTRVSGGLRRLLRWSIPLNLASANDLEALPRIGPKRAAAIVADRNEHGPFPRVASLQRVRGVGPATAALLRDALHVRGPDPCESAPRRVH